MSAVMAALIAEGDRWLEQAVATYQGGGGSTVTAAEAAIAGAYYTRAALEKPDTLAALLAAGAVQQRAAQQAGPTMAERTQEQLDREAAKASGRHPAGRNRPPGPPVDGGDAGHAPQPGDVKVMRDGQVGWERAEVDDGMAYDGTGEVSSDKREDSDD